VNTRASRLGRLAERRWVRVTVVGLVALTAYTLGAAYLSLGPVPDQTSFMVVGGKGLRADGWGVVRVSAHGNQSRAARAVNVGSVRLDGATVPVKVQGDDPAIVRFQVPASTGPLATLELDVRAGERASTLTLKRSVSQPPFDRIGPAEPPDIRDTQEFHLVDLLPEDGTLALGMKNRLFVHVRHRDGKPASDVEVQITHPLLPGGRLDLEADSAGLAAFELVASQPTLRIGTEVREGDRRTLSHDLMRPMGRRIRVRPEAVVTPLSADVTVSIETWEEEVPVYCDLVDGEGRWLDSVRIEGRAHRARWSLGRLARGAYDVQCYDHPVAPGESFATSPLFVSEQDPVSVLRDTLIHRGWAHPKSLARPRGEDTSRSLDFMAARLRHEPTLPQVLLSTVGGDRDASEAAREHTKTRLLMAMAALFLVVFLWVIDAIVRNVIRTRRSMRAFTLAALMEDGELESSDVTGLGDQSHMQELRFTRTRGVLLIAMVGVTILLNLLALLGLFALIR
jgi:hypothetical protein